jgi:acid phosphatase (class A)
MPATCLGRRIAGVLLILLLGLLPAAQALSPPEPYSLVARIDLATLLPPPPLSGSAAEQADLAAVLAVQQSRTEAELAQAKADAEASIFRFADVAGAGFDAASLPRTAYLFERLTRSIGAVVNPAKDHWNRPRPFVVSDAVKPASRPDGATYPSGHGTLARLYAIVLADLLPHKRREIFARGERFAQARLVLGVHYPSDIEAAAIAATVIATELRQQEDYRRDLAAARSEIDAWQTARKSATTP